MLFTHLRIHQLFGANTDVGKTIFSTVLALASCARDTHVFYLKPVSTGPPEDDDYRFVQLTPRFAVIDETRLASHIRLYTPKGARILPRSIFKMDDPVSPHLAALTASKVCVICIALCTRGSISILHRLSQMAL
jgi:dethiobiotin synthetase/adenosylmethionine--8-amino-7-oxononanoate aminotransferase